MLGLSISTSCAMPSESLGQPGTRAVVAEVAVAAGAPHPPAPAGTLARTHFSPPPALSKRGGTCCSFLPHTGSSSLGGTGEKQIFRTGKWGEIQSDAFTGLQVTGCCNSFHAVFLQQRTQTHSTFNLLSSGKFGLFLCFLSCPAP